MKKKFIGFYRDCDLLTMTGTCMALLGCVFAINGNRLIPIFLLILSGICDGFDGKLARRHKSTEEQSTYGVQLDSLSDLIGESLVQPTVNNNSSDDDSNSGYDSVLY